MQQHSSIGVVSKMRMIKWLNGVVLTPDQTKLPLQEVTLEIKTVDQMAEAIKVLRVRGAPLLGAAAGFGVALAAYHSKAKNKEKLFAELEEIKGGVLEAVCDRSCC